MKLFLFLQAPLALAGAVQPLDNPGEFFVTQARKRLSVELREVYAFREPAITDKEIWLVSALDELLTYQIPIEFVEPTDPRLKLHPEEPARTAVTGTALAAPILFNRGIINRPNEFTYADAVRMLVHELGHKVHPDLKKQFPQYQTTVDELAAKISEIVTARDRELPLKVGGRSARLRVHYSFVEDNWISDSPSDRYDDAIWPMIFAQLGDQAFLLDEAAYRSLYEIN